MKRKIGFTATPMPKNWVRGLYIILRRKLRKINPDLMIGIVAIVILLLQVFIIVTAVKGQERPRGLQIGDKVPDVTITNIINHPTGTAKISDFKGKLLILDFWATWCSPCVSMIPKTDSLQKQFEGKVQFLPATYQSDKEVLPFLNKLEKSKRVRWMTATGDTQLGKLFPHVELPHYVWVDREGVVKFITDHKAVTEESIRKFLDADGMQLRQKQDAVVAHDRSKPFLIGNNGGDGRQLIYHSVLSACTDGLPTQFTIMNGKDGASPKVIMTNSTLVNLYKVAFRDYGYFGNNRTVLETADTIIRRPPTGMEYDDWKRKYTYNYELIVPPSLKDSMMTMMQADLERLFPRYRGSVEKKAVECLVLTRTSSADKLRSRGGKPAVTFDAFGFSMTNYPISRLIGQLNVLALQKSPMPVVDETGYSGRVDLTLNASLSNVEALNGELAKYDLKLEPKTREINVLVIRDRNRF